jgi:protein-disulfide isomerase-like protein with CxxC motif
MTLLGRRLAALEQLAEETRRRVIREVARELATERGLDLEHVMARFDQARAERNRLRVEGLADRHIFERTAAGMGITPDELQRRVDDLLARFG